MQSAQNILIVDDRPENLFALESILSDLDAAVIKAGSANDALVAALNHEFALAIVDVHMPDMDGYELADLLRSHKRTRELPIIFLSAVFYGEEHAVMGYRVGAVDFITKPFHPQILLGKAASFLELSRQRQEGKRYAAMLQSSNQVLEAKVKERTARLELSNRALQESEQQLRTLSRKLLSAQEEERKRIAAELHDSIGSSLGAIKFGLEGALHGVVLDDGTRRMVDDVIKMVLHATEDVRRIMNNLRPPLLDRLGLISTIADFQKQFESMCGRIAFRKQIRVREEDIPEPVKIVIFRVMQEAFHNMVKYSRATEAHLELMLDHGALRLRIADNGIGFELAGTARGLGLTSMRERVELSGGRFGIQSSPGQGTRIEAAWPQGSAEKSKS
jgi:signal transduction histidine kinase